MSDDVLIAEAYRVFQHEECPKNPTYAFHCKDCENISNLLSSLDRNTLTEDDFALDVWGHLSLVDEKTFRHFFPALVRLVLTNEDKCCYLDQFLFHISGNRHCMTFTEEQCDFVIRLLKHLNDTLRDEMDEPSREALDKTMQVWATESISQPSEDKAEE